MRPPSVNRKGIVIILYSLYFLCYLLLCCLCFVSPLKQAFAFIYFNRSIDYWESQDSSKGPRPIPQQKLPQSPRTKDLGRNHSPKKTHNFDWEPYLNPKTTHDLRELFREGEHTPPTPLLEVTRNPTDENIKKWFELVKKKNLFLSQLNQKMTGYLKRTKQLSLREKSLIKKQRASIRPSSMDYKRFRLRMYFESSCPHCQRMMDELIKLQDMGFYVELRQIDSNKESVKGLPFLVSKASPSEIKEKKINSWPVLFIGDQKKKVVYRINGFHRAEDILLTLQAPR